MREQTLRTIGATVVLFGIAVAAILQVGPGGDPSAIALTAVPEPAASEPLSGPTVTEAIALPSSTAPEPFVYRIGVLAGVTTTNYWAFFAEEPSVWNSYILGPTKAALFAIDPSSGGLEPELASEIPQPQQTADGWQVQVQLRTDHLWSDGSPITASDVEFTFDTVRALGLGGSWASVFPATVRSIEARADDRLVIRFEQRPTIQMWPNGPGLAPVMSRAFWSDQIEGIDADGLLALPGEGDPSGGPLVIESVTTNLLRSIGNLGYPLGSAPDVVEYFVFDSEDSAVGALKMGAIDFFLTPKGLTPEEADRLRVDAAIDVTSSPANAIRYLGFNLDREPMSDINFRTALALLLDRSALASELPEGAELSYALVSEHNANWASQEGHASAAGMFAGTLTSRLERALIGLRSAGYTWEAEPFVDDDGRLVAGSGLMIDGADPAPLTILTPGDEYDELRPAHARLISDALAFLGFEVRPVETDFDSVVDLAFTPDDDGRLHYDMYLLGWTLGSPVWPGFYGPMFSSTGSANNTGYSSEVFDQALAAYEGAHDMDQAVSALWEMESVLARDLPYLLLYAPGITEAHRSDRVSFTVEPGLGGIQARLGGILDVEPSS